MGASTIEDARRVKDKARAEAAKVATVTGVGLTKVKGAYAVKVNFEEAPDLSALPREIDGVEIVYDVSGTIKPR